MLPKLRRVSSILRNNNSNPTESYPTNNKMIQSTERLSNKSSSSSSKSTEDGNNGKFN
jgi:hypothetical protein